MIPHPTLRGYAGSYSYFAACCGERRDNADGGGIKKLFYGFKIKSYKWEAVYQTQKRREV